MVRRVLVANRGEIALRIVRACKELGLETVAAHARVDSGQLHLRHADDTVCLSDVSYLDVRAVIAAAQSRGCDAIHPGYGMLAENAGFARAVESAGITLIGPSADLIARMGDKQAARHVAGENGLSILPGTEEGELKDAAEAASLAAVVGYPVILKAMHGGGGRGMRIVDGEAAMDRAFAEARAESQAGFGSAALYLEKYLAAPRHIEVQVLGDGEGAAIHLGTRDCSIQRRYQKLVEEAPAPSIGRSLLEELGNRCAAIVAQLGYGSAGTLEFLYHDGVFYFIEMNTRIQVEHPVTEMITGIDLVKAQLEIALTARLPVRQAEVVYDGHAIECRINAETVDKESGRTVPSPGLAYDYIAPGGPGIRIDSHLYNGYVVPHQYDSLIAKLLAWGRTREEAVSRARRGLSEFAVRGIDTNVELLQSIVDSKRFRDAELDTHFLDA